MQKQKYLGRIINIIVVVIMFTTLIFGPALSVQAATGVTLGVTLPATPATFMYNGAGPIFADTYVTPFVVTKAGKITTWKGQFDPGQDIPFGVQLKIFRATTDPNIIQVVAEGSVHSPGTIINPNTVVQFTDSAISVKAGDKIGITIFSNPSGIGIYSYPFVTSTRNSMGVMQQNLSIGGNINLADPYTAIFASLAPAIQVTETLNQNGQGQNNNGQGQNQ